MPPPPGRLPDYCFNFSVAFIYISIQLFRQRLSQKSVKAHATMSIGIMGSKSLALLDWDLRRFSNKERERTITCLCCFLPPLWNTLRFSQATVKTTITHNNFRHGRVSFSPFVRQPFSKQLYRACALWTHVTHWRQLKTARIMLSQT